MTENAERAPPLAVIVAGAAAVLKGVRLLSLTTALSAVLLWSWLFSPFQFNNWWSVVLVTVVLLLLLGPSVVLFFVAVALGQLAHLPRALIERSQEARSHLGTAASSVRPGAEVTGGRRAWTLGRALFDLWTLVVESKGMLLQYAGMVRLANPVSLFIVGIALVTSVTLIGVTVVGLGVSLVF